MESVASSSESVEPNLDTPAAAASNQQQQQQLLHAPTALLSTPLTAPAALSVAAACLSSLLLGYDIGVMSGALLFIVEAFSLSDVQEEVLVGVLNLVAAFGGLAAGLLSDKLGRKAVIATASALFLVGAFLMAVSVDFVSLMFGRVITGLGVGTGLLIAPLYAAEITPAHLRGSMVAIAEISIVFGIFLGYFASAVLAYLPDSYNWRLMLGFGCVPALALIGSLFYIPETPRWLISKGRHEAAMKSLMMIHNGNAEIARQEAHELEAFVQELQLAGSAGSGWRRVLCASSSEKHCLIIGLGLQSFQQAIGSEAIVYYIPYILKLSGITNSVTLLWITVFVGVSKVTFIFLATYLLDKVGRRVLLLASAFGITTSLVLLVTSSWGSDLEILVASALFIYAGSFSLGYGPATWVVCSEIFPLEIRGKSMSMATFLNRLLSGLCAITFLSLVDSMGLGGTFSLYLGISILGIIFIYFIIPETKQKSLEQIEMELKNRTIKSNSSVTHS